jgi:hypothetical protein
LLLAAQRLEDERDAKIAANQAYEEYRATGRDTQGHRLGTRPNPWTAPDVPDGMVSVSDPDSQRMKARSRLSPWASTPKGIILPRWFHGSGRPRANHRGGPGEARLREPHPRPQRGSRDGYRRPVVDVVAGAGVQRWSPRVPGGGPGVISVFRGLLALRLAATTI